MITGTELQLNTLKADCSFDTTVKINKMRINVLTYYHAEEFFWRQS